MPNNQLFDLEHRQDKLLQKLDVLYDRIKKISLLCLLNDQSTKHEIRQKNVVDTVSNTINKYYKIVYYEILVRNQFYFINSFCAIIIHH